MLVMHTIVGPRMSGTIQKPRMGAGCLQGSGLVQRMCSTKHFCSAASSCRLSLSSSSDPRNLKFMNPSKPDTVYTSFMSTVVS